MQGLWEAHRGTERAIETGDPEAVYQGEAAIHKALHALERHMRDLPESRRERAQELLDQGIEIVDALHKAGEAGDVRALEQLVRKLGTLIAKMQTLFHRSAEEILPGLREAHRGTERAVETGDLEAVYQGEAAIHKALHELEGHTQSLPESRRERAQELLDRGIEIV